MASSKGRHEPDHISIELASGDIAGADINIPVGYEPQIKRNKKASSLRTLENGKLERKEKLTNKNILYSAKRGYSVLLIIVVLLLAVLTIYVMAKNNKLRYYLFNGLTACIISLLLMIPIFILYRFLEKKIIVQYDTINNKIIETFSLKQQLQHKNEQNLQQEQYINNLKLIIAEQENKINKLSDGMVTNGNRNRLHLINGFRKGQMEIQIEFAEIDQLVAMLNVVVSCITLLPFGQTNYRKKLKHILQQKIEKNKYLQMHFYFFLLSYVECTDVKRLFRRHKIMKKVKSLAEHYEYHDDNDDGMTIFSDTGTAHSASAPFSPYTDASPIDIHLNLNDGGFPDHTKALNTNITNPPFNPQQIICFKEKDPIKLFRAPIDHKTKPGARIMVPLDLQNRFFDPINGSKFLQQLVVRDIFNSNAKPYLIDCFVKKTTSNTINDDVDIKQDIDDDHYDDDDDDIDLNFDGMRLSSTFILKQGDDIRKDQAILQMFSFMNDIWRENNLKYQNGINFVQCLIYKCIPMGNDVGIIEMIPNCIELNKIIKLKSSFRTNITERDVYMARNRYNKLITSAAAAYIASFVCGVRDRHHDNVLINIETYSLFHIDFGYIFNDTTTLDTAKFAITTDLKNLLNVYKNGWNDFIELARDSWMVLRQNSTELIDFARSAFAFLYKSNDIEQFIRDSLKLDLNQENAMKYITNHLTKAPNKWRTKMKNLAHSFAQKMKKKSKNKSVPSPLTAPQSRSAQAKSPSLYSSDLSNIIIPNQDININNNHNRYHHRYPNSAVMNDILSPPQSQKHKSSNSLIV